MHVTGIVEGDHSQAVINVIKYMISAENKKISVLDYGSQVKSKDTCRSYLSALEQIGTDILIVRVKAKDLEQALYLLPIDTLIVNDYPEWCMVYSLLQKELKKISNKI